MKILWLFLLVLNTVFADVGFGSSYLKNNRLCRPWECINNKLGLPDALPSKEQLASTLLTILPPGAYTGVVDEVVKGCYDDRARKYTNTCPGQSLLHCVYDNLIQNCPAESLRKDDACAPLSSLAGFKYMFSQSRYEDMENQWPADKRPVWFLKNYFSSKCCNLPELFNATVMAECGFNEVVHYYTHEPHSKNGRPFNKQTTATAKDTGKLHVVDLNLYNPPDSPVFRNKNTIQVAEIPQSNELDPLDCCDMSELIQPAWRSECDFHLSWKGQDRLVIRNTSVPTPPPTTTPRSTKAKDVRIVPLSCEKENCIFRQLNIVRQNGSVDITAFQRLLDNLTTVHPEWEKAKTKVVTHCILSSWMPRTGYDTQCEINKLLGCTFDILSENCPFAKQNDPCKRGKGDGSTCQISSSKYRPKHRRTFCGLPNLVSHEVLSQCEATAVSTREYVSEPTYKRASWWTSKYLCQDLTASTKCVLEKMGVMSKYGFMDYFKMKDTMSRFKQRPEWHMVLNTFNSMPMYKQYCSSPKRLLNILDSILLTCPVSKRQNTRQCVRLFDTMITTPPVLIAPQNQPIVPQIALLPLHHLYTNINTGKTHVTSQTKPKKHVRFNDISQDKSEIKTMAIKPVVISKKPIVTLPVYLRTHGEGKGSVSVRRYPDPALRSMNSHNGLPEVGKDNVHDRPYSVSDPVLRNNPIQLHGLAGSYNIFEDARM